ncbi:MAG: hypothetical protein RIS35_2907 [Pseudomonadota bacterium]|jgi:hypothetical protein
MPGIRLHAPLIAASLVLSGCSVTKLGYDVLPTWVHWQAERYLDLDEQQRAIVGRRVEEVHQWHRRTQLPRYARFLRDVGREVEDGVDAEELGRWRDEVSEAWTSVAERLAPGVAELALTLRPEQLERLRERLDEGLEKARETMLPAGEAARERARLDRIVKRAEFFLGSLSRAQVRAFRPAIDALPPVEEAWIEERRARQHHLLALLNRIRREKPPRDEATRMCREFLVSMWQSRDARRRHRIEQGIEASDTLSARILSEATPRQREHLARLIRDLIEDFGLLAGK